MAWRQRPLEVSATRSLVRRHDFCGGATVHDRSEKESPPQSCDRPWCAECCHWIVRANHPVTRQPQKDIRSCDGAHDVGDHREAGGLSDGVSPTGKEREHGMAARPG
jgi:hypothetical protein